MSILITGAAGLIGSNLAHWIIDNTEHTVIGVDDLSGGYESNCPDNGRFRFIKLDVLDDYLDNLFKIYVPNIVFHFAAYAAECVSPFIRKFNYTNNIVATANVVNCCIKYNIKRLVFSSSMAVYGNGVVPPFSEEEQTIPIDSYGVAKLACELDIKISGEQHNLDWCIIRPHNIYGERQNIWDSYRNVIGIFLYKSLIGDPMTIYGDGEQERAFTYIDDILEPLFNAAILPEASKQIINLGGINEYSINEAAGIIKELTGADIIYLPPRHEVKYAYSTWDKSVRILKFEHKTPLKDGVEKMLQWAKDQPKRPRFIWNQYEIENGVYEYWKPETLKDGYYKK